MGGLREQNTQRLQVDYSSGYHIQNSIVLCETPRMALGKYAVSEKSREKLYVCIKPLFILG